MTGPVSLAVLSTGCVCVAEHSPTAYVPTRHHRLPQSWGGPSVADNLVTLCPSTHTAVHRLIDEYVRHGGDPGWDTRRHFGAYARDLAARAWEQRPVTPTITSLHVAAG
ncbi:MAG: HNH endonuclease [Mycobacteriales bacterium]